MAMLNLVFGFNARIRRLQFFLASLALGLVMGVFVVAYGMHAVQGASRLRPADIVTSRPMLIAIALFMYATFILQSMRFRDIGWDPVCVVPAWIAIVFVDHFVTVKFPTLSIGQEHFHTAAGAVVNLGLYLALAFWPSGDFEIGERPSSGGASRLSEPVPERAAARLAVTGVAGGFGRRAS
jgi:uncharacterized membrane protein YhaH (DUF805 family)